MWYVVFDTSPLPHKCLGSLYLFQGLRNGFQLLPQMRLQRRHYQAILLLRQTQYGGQILPAYAHSEGA